MSYYQKGDAVRLLVDHPEGNGNICKGDVAVICDIVGDRLGLKFDKQINGHACDGNCDRGHGWYVNSNIVEPLESDEPWEEDCVDTEELMAMLFG